MSVAAAGDAARSDAPARRAPRARGFAFWLGGVVAAGMGLRVAQTLLIAPWPPGFFNDELYYSALGKKLAQGTGFVRPGEWLGQHLAIPTAERPPLYPLALAGLAKLGLTSSDVQRLLGTLTGGVTILLLGLVARRLAGDRAGLLAAGIAAAYPALIAADGALMTESLFGGAGRGDAAGRAAPRRRPGTGARGGAGGGRRGRRPGAQRGAPAAAARAAAAAAPPGRPARGRGRRRRLRGRPHAVDRAQLVDLRPARARATEGGETLRGANCESAYHGENLGSWQASCLGFHAFPGVNEAEEFDREGHDGVRYALDPPGRAARGRRAPGADLGRVAVLPGSRGAAGLGHARRRRGLLPAPAARGLGRVALRRRGVGAALWIVLTPVVSVTVTTLLSYGTLRFRHSVELVLVVLAAVGIDALWRRRAARGRPAPGG